MSSAVAQAATSSAAAAPVVALLPLTITFDALLLGLLGAAASRGTTSSASWNGGGSGFHDPADWVAECKGPLFCPEYRHFVCTGRPGACECHCEVTPPACVPAVPENGASMACREQPPPTPPKGRVATR